MQACGVHRTALALTQHPVTTQRKSNMADQTNSPPVGLGGNKTWSEPEMHGHEKQLSRTVWILVPQHRRGRAATVA
jgi:hypothetical protein